jgi:hypothetical protein
VVYRAFEQNTSLASKAINIVNQLICIIYIFMTLIERGLGEVIFIY